MRYTVLLLSLSTFVIFAFGWSRIQQQNAMPDIHVVGSEIFDAGTVPPNKPVSHTFKIINMHAFPIGLSMPVAGCSCTTATASASSISANGFAEVTLRVEAEDRNLSGSASIITTHAQKIVETWLIVKATLVQDHHLPR